MAPSCSLLGIAAPRAPEVQPFRFLDLPIEIRYMIYEQFMDRHVIVTVPGLGLPECISNERTQILTCFHPAMLRVNKQFATEYAAFVVPRMVLLTDWSTRDHDTAPEEVQSDQKQPPVLPERVIAGFDCLTLRLNMDTPIPHCNPQAAIRALTSRMLRLRLLVFISEYDIDPVLQETSMADSTEFHKHDAWKQEMIRFLQELAEDERSLWAAMAKFHIICGLYCLLDSSAEDEPASDVVFAICNLPDEDTFELDGLYLKFMGSDRLQVELKAIGDGNMVTSIRYVHNELTDEALMAW